MFTPPPTFAHGFGDFGQLGVLAHQFQELSGDRGGGGLPLFAGQREGFAMLCVGIRMGLVAVRLAGLGQQDERRGVGGLQAERQIEQDERIDIEMEDARRVECDPHPDHDRLADEKHRRAEKPCKTLRLESEPIVAENRREMPVGRVEAEMIAPVRL